MSLDTPRNGSYLVQVLADLENVFGHCEQLRLSGALKEREEIVRFLENILHQTRQIHNFRISKLNHKL